jgi:xylulokinase
MDQSVNGGDCFIGFDLGTSGARMSIVEKKSAGRFDEVVTEALSWDSSLQFDNANDWRKAIDNLLSRAKGKGKIDRVKAICVSGTSATCLLVKRHTLDVSRKARMYNFDVKAQSSTAVENVMALIEKYVPEKHTARATTGTLAKLLLWSEEKSLVDEVLCHQSDYVSLSLMYEGHHGDEKDITTHCDFHNILKLGYDVRALEYPLWMMKLLKEGANIPHPEDVLPSKVISPGEPIGIISPVVAAKYGLSSDVVLVGGTTDSNAAFFAAAGANPEYGTAVTSLGSTMAIKQLSSTYVEDASRGVYSHRFPRFGSSGGMESNDGKEEEAWLIGGASNVGCAVLRSEDFSNEELTSLSLEIDPNEDSPLSYYPLIKAGERFPVADSTK